jgi:peptidoglycan/xylan/chitin deacetylase (PgdA/CDA1 family)
MTVVLGKPGWMTRAQVRALDRSGMTIGAHTWDHKAVPDYAGTDWPRQVLRPPIDLARIVGHPVHLFAYPYGLWTRSAFDHLRQAGMTAAFQLSGRLDRRAPLWTLRRIIVPQVSGADLRRSMRREF